MVNWNGKANAAIPAGVSVVAGDATDPESARKAAQGASVVYNALNAPNYEQWVTQFPPLQRGVLEGAARVGAKLVVMENLYMYGPDRRQTAYRRLALPGQGRQGQDASHAGPGTYHLLGLPGPSYFS